MSGDLLGDINNRKSRMILKLNGKWNVSSLRRNPAKATNPTHPDQFCIPEGRQTPDSSQAVWSEE